MSRPFVALIPVAQYQKMAAQASDVRLWRGPALVSRQREPGFRRHDASLWITRRRELLVPSGVILVMRQGAAREPCRSPVLELPSWFLQPHCPVLHSPEAVAAVMAAEAMVAVTAADTLAADTLAAAISAADIMAACILAADIMAARGLQPLTHSREAAFAVTAPLPGTAG